MKRGRPASECLRDILEHGQAAIEFAGELADPDALASDRRTLWAVIRALEVIGEAARNVPEEVRRAHPEIPWRGMTGMRDKVIHGYFGIDAKIVWATVRHDLPAMCSAVGRLLDTLDLDGRR